MVIYKITNIVNNKIYIGQTKFTAEQRFNKHWNEACCKNRPNNKFHNALKKYGKENFIVETIDTAETQEELNEKEYIWIQKLNATDSNIGYNLQEGGKSGKLNSESKEKIRQKKLENWQDPIFAQKCRQGLNKATKAWQEQCENNKIEIVCAHCGKTIKLPPWEAERRKYCSIECANAENVQKATKAAAEKKKQATQERNINFQQDVLDWCQNNKSLIMNCPYNKISTTLIDLQILASTKYNFSDWRSIGQALCKTNSKKEILNYLKQICENVC